MPSIECDALLAVTGIFPRDITPRDHAASQAIVTKWEQRLRRWVSAEAKPFKYVPPKNLEALWLRLATPPSEPEVQAWVEGMALDPILVADYFLGLTAARDYLVAAWPKYTYDTLAGPKILPLSPDDTEEVWSQILVLDDPERILDEMDSRTLTAAQVAAFKTAYPELYAFANQILDDEIASQLARNPDWAPGWEWEAMLRTLRGAPPEDAPPPTPPPPPPPKPFKIDPEREETQAQVSAKPKGGK